MSLQSWHSLPERKNNAEWALATGQSFWQWNEPQESENRDGRQSISEALPPLPLGFQRHTRFLCLEAQSRVVPDVDLLLTKSSVPEALRASACQESYGAGVAHVCPDDVFHEHECVFG